MKRLFDCSLALAGLLLSSPLCIIIIMAIWFQDGGPVFYSGTRIGRRGRLFKMYKFRSLIHRSNGKAGNRWTSENDPRVTKVGHILRNTAMDELPQLVNIIKGDISFVGPRPEDPELAAQFSAELPDFNRRHCIRPGLTGLAQIYGNYDSSPLEKLNYDMLYIKKQSFWLDLKLLFFSLWVTFRWRWEKRGRKV